VGWARRDTVALVRWGPLLSLVAACSSSPAPSAVTDAAAPPDVPAPDVPDVPALDAPALDAVTDRPRADIPRDTADVPLVEDVTAVPADVVIDPGMCGMGVRACFCRCGANAVCQQGCINADEDCGFCVYLAATRCCAAQSAVLDRCIDAAMCNDDPCIRTRCMGEVAAFEGCFASAQMTEPACQRELRGCLGADYPQVRCVVQR